MRQSIRSVPLWAVLVSCTPSLISQDPPTKSLPPVPATYAAESLIIRHAANLFDMKSDGTGTRDESFAVTLQTEAALRQLGVIGIPFASASEKVEFRYVRVRHPDGSVTDTPLEGVQEQTEQVTREAPFYSDLKQMQLPVKGLRVGDTLEWQVHIARFKPEASNQFWGAASFGRDAVIEDQRIELRIPSATHATVWTNPQNSTKPTESDANGQHIYTWNYKQLDPTAGPIADAAAKAKKTKPLSPEETQNAEEGRLPDIAWTTFTSWEALGAWYRSLEADRMQPDATVKAKVAEITAGKLTQEDKVKAVYAWVSGQIRYIGVAFGVGRYQPHSASAVLENQYGDCKDKHTLLASMLLALGLHPDAVLIGPGVRFNSAVPSPASFNHLITRVALDGKSIWLDTTAEVVPFRLLPPLDRDKQSLVVPSEAPATIEHSPSAFPYTPFSSFAAVGALDKDLTSDSRIVLTLRDDDELAIRAVLRQVSPAQYEQLVQSLMSNMGFGGTTSEAEVLHGNDTSQPLVISFHYHRVKEADWGTDRITVPFQLIGLPFVDEKNLPLIPFALGILRTETSTIDMKLPEHWSAELPEATHAHSPYALCDVTYGLDKGILHAQRQLTVLREKVLPTDWKAYKTWYDNCGASGVPFVQLTHNAGLTSSTHAVPSNHEAATLIQQANDAIIQHDTDKALTLLDQANALNSEEKNLWSTYGYRAYDLGMVNEAIVDYRRELFFHPDLGWVYSPLAEELLRAGRRDEAIETLRAGIALNPQDLRANSTLVQMLSSQPNGSKAAIAAGVAALKILPPEDPTNAPLVLAVATQQVAVGSLAEAAAILSAALKVATLPEIQNNVAYLLAQTGIDLPAAEAAERSVLDTLTAESNTWTLDENPLTLRQKSALLAASWDTMGWIMFLEGHIPEARSYIQPVWHLRPSLELGRHLGDIALADHNPTAASEAYQLALATIPPGAGKDNPPMAAEVERNTQGQARAKKAAAPATLPEIKNTRPALQKLRTVSLGPANDRKGTAEYRILIAHGKAELIRPNTEATLPNTDALLKAVSFAAFTPSGYDGKLVLFGMLNCTSEACDFVVEP